MFLLVTDGAATRNTIFSDTELHGRLQWLSLSAGGQCFTEENKLVHLFIKPIRKLKTKYKIKKKVIKRKMISRRLKIKTLFSNLAI